jgi:hypothetical protein
LSGGINIAANLCARLGRLLGRGELDEHLAEARNGA